MIALLKKYKEVLLYLVFGGLTTLVNILVYFVCDSWLHWGTVLSTIIAWVLSVIFAFVTNKQFVFESKQTDGKTLLYEVSSFFGCRAFSGVLDLLIMWLTVDIFHWHSLLMKVLSNIVVIILNYVFSKLIIFRKKTA
ncbi:MAG: GtrA family protein [Oscillospiraceae bacterium]|nr:GtrA family protein [Oscillospiraceae bacterium]